MKPLRESHLVLKPWRRLWRLRGTAEMLRFQEALDSLRAEVISLQSACKNTSATMQQIKETLKEFMSLKRDFDGLKRESEHHSSQISNISRGVGLKICKH